MRQSIYLAFVLSAIWLLNSGHYNALILFFGLVSLAFVLWLARRMDVIDHETTPFYLTPHLPGYYAWLIKQIVASNLDVVRRIWRGPEHISPCLERLPVSQATDMGKVIYANSITLTPGTLVVNLETDTVTVHALSREGMAALKTGEMDRRVRQLEQ